MNLIISKFSSSEINQGKVAFGSFFLLNHKDKYVLHILTSEPEKNYAEFVKRIKPFCKIEFYNSDILEHISETCKDFKSIILLHQNTLTLQQIDIYYDYFKNFQMVGNLRYQTEYDLINEGYNIPFVDGVFSNGWLMLNNIEFDMDYVQRFINTFKIQRTRKDFDEIFLSFLCVSKLKTPDISVESTYYHNTSLENLKLVYFSENPYNAYPWSNTEKTIYIFYYIEEYKKICKIFKCDFLKPQKIPTLNEFENDLKHRFIFKGWDKVFIPFCERDYHFDFF